MADHAANDIAGDRPRGAGAVTSRATRIWRWIAGSLATVAILSALLVGAFRLALEALPEYEAQVADRIREATGLRLSFDSLDARLGRYGPEIFFAGARIDAPDGRDTLVTADAGRASLSVLRSAWYRRLEIGRVVLERPQLNLVIFPDRHIELVGQAGMTRPELAPGQRRRGLDRIPRGIIEIRGATVAFVDLRGERAAWQLTNVDLELDRAGDRVSLTGGVGLPPQLGRSLAFEARVEGDLEELRELDWQGRFEAKDVDLAGWADLLPETFHVPSAGRGDVRLRASGTGAAFRRGRAVLALDGLALPPAAAGVAPVVYRRLAADVVVQREESGWRVSGSDIELALPGSEWTPTDLDAAVLLDAGRLDSIRLKARFLRLQNLTPFTALMPDSAARTWIERLAPRGDLRRIDVEVSDIRPREVPLVRGSFAFDDLGMEPVERVPGLDGVDGRLRAEGETGTVELAARDVTMDWPAEWREPAGFPRVDATVGWSRALGGLRLWADDVVASDGRATAEGRLRLLARAGFSPLMDIVASVTADDISHVSRYMPKQRIKPRPLEWLDAAFVRGRITRGEAEITGPARGFPYREGQGRFRATARVEDVALRYGPGWQPVTGLNADIEFDGTSMRVRDASGVVEGIRVRNGSAEILDWRQGILSIRADATADATDAHRFLAGSPIGPGLGKTFAALEASGPVEGEVVMYLPMKQFEDRSITVRARALGVDCALEGVDARVEGLTGEAWFRNREITAPTLRGRFLGGDGRAEVATVERPDGGLLTTVVAQGIIDASLLPRVVRLPLDSGLTGETAWSGRLDIRRPRDPGGETTSRVQLESSLAGLGSGLPEPLAKDPQEARPLRLDIQIEPASVLARASLGSDLRALLDLRRSADKGIGLSSGIVRLGGGEVRSVPVGPGLRVDGRVPYLSISRLTSLSWATPPRVPLESLLSSVSLDVGRLEVLGYEFEQVRGRLRPGRAAWDVEIDAPAARGQLRVPYRFPGEVPLVLDLDILRAGGRAAGRPGGETDPRKLPAMRIDVRDLEFEGRRLGHLSAELSPGPDGLVLDRFTSQQAAFRASGSGGWRVTDERQRSTLDFEVDIGDVKGFLEAMQFAPLIEGRKGQVSASLDWPGGPDARVLERVSGSVRLRLEDGRVLSVEPGAGRILGLMSIAHLPRRLSLDFDDLTGQGLAFDSIRGDFTLASGEAYTDNLTLRGAAAEVGIAGRTSLRDRTYDQTAVVTGDLGASLGVAGAIAGGPAVGAALLLFSQIFKEPLKGVARGYYRISGPWEDPLVRKIDARELEEAAGLGAPPAPAPAPSADAPPTGAS